MWCYSRFGSEVAVTWDGMGWLLIREWPSSIRLLPLSITLPPHSLLTSHFPTSYNLNRIQRHLFSLSISSLVVQILFPSLSLSLSTLILWMSNGLTFYSKFQHMEFRTSIFQSRCLLPPPRFHTNADFASPFSLFITNSLRPSSFTFTSKGQSLLFSSVAISVLPFAALY